MRKGLLLAFAICAAFAFTGCGIFGSDKNSGDFYSGVVNVGLTDNVPASGTYVIQNIYNPAVRQVIAVVQIEDAKVGSKIVGRWYQMNVFQRKLDNATAEGLLISEAGFDITKESINADSKRGGGRLTLTPNSALPEDSYELRVFVDGKLAKVQPFVVSILAQAPANPTSPTPAATPVRTATPSR